MTTRAGGPGAGPGAPTLDAAERAALAPARVGDRLRCVRARLEAPTCSFRYPHFVVGRQPSYEHPPPSTLLGLVAGALGLLEPPAGLRLATHFRAAGRFDDLEHQHKLKFSRGKRGLTGTIDGVEPVLREALAFARLELYLVPETATPGVERDDLLARLARALRSPAFGLSLGRSQDLAVCGDASVVELEARPAAYYEATLLPFAWRAAVPRGVTALLPRAIGPAPERDPRFARYVVLHDRVYAGLDDQAAAASGRRVEVGPDVPPLHWVDPDAPADQEGARPRGAWLLDPGFAVGRGVVFHAPGLEAG